MSTDTIDTDTTTTPAGTFRATYSPDPTAMSPRDADNVGRVTISHRHVVDVDPDGDVARVLDQVQDGRIGTRAACRYLRLVLGARVVLPVHVSESWSWANEYVVGSPDEAGAEPDGFTYDDPADPTGCLAAGMADDEIEAALRAELTDYSRWAAGEFVEYVIERLVDPLGEADPDDEDAVWEHVDSCGSIDSLDSARDMANDIVTFYRPEHFLSPVLAAQV